MVLLISVVLVACAPVATNSPRANNFALVFQDFACASVPVNVLDTASSTLVHTPLGDTTSLTISLRLTEAELEAIYQKAMAIGFFDYPAKFVIPDQQVLGYQARVFSYQLSMTNGEMTNSVSWQDDTITKSDYTKADQLRELIELIRQSIQSHPEVQQLPEPEVRCI